MNNELTKIILMAALSLTIGANLQAETAHDRLIAAASQTEVGFYLNPGAKYYVYGINDSCTILYNGPEYVEISITDRDNEHAMINFSYWAEGAWYTAGTSMGCVTHTDSSLGYLIVEPYLGR